MQVENCRQQLLPRLAHKLANCSAHKCTSAVLRILAKNEDWPPIFILNLANCLDQLLIFGSNSLVYVISFSRLLFLEANNLIQVIPLSQLAFYGY